MRNKKDRVVFFGILLSIVLLIGGTYAWLKISVTGSTENIIHAGKLDLVLDDNASDGIHMKDAIPVSDAKGNEQEGYQFSLVNRGTVTSRYTLYLDDLDIEPNEVRIPDSVMSYSLEKDGAILSSGLVANLGSHPNRILDSGVIEGKKTNHYTLKVWMNKDATIDHMGMIFYTKIRAEVEKAIDSSKYIELTPDSKEKVPINEGDDYRNYTYTSSDLNVVKVDEKGNIEVVGPGYATITKTDSSGKGEDTKVHVTIPVKTSFETSDKIESIGKVDGTCDLTENNQTTCQINLPTVKVRDGYEFVGWSTKSNSATGEKEKMQISLEDAVLYPIIKTLKNTYTATFEKGNGIASVDYETISCTTDETYDNQEVSAGCKIKLPNATPEDGYVFIGWSTEAGALDGSPANTEVTINSNQKFYAIYRKNIVQLTATFKLNGAKSLNGSTREELKISCTPEVYNSSDNGRCMITLPEIVGSEDTPNVIGFNENEDATEDQFHGEKTIELTKDVTYYAITSSATTKLTVTFYRNDNVSLDGEGIDYVTKECNNMITYNGEKQKGCTITTPKIEPSKNTPTVLGYSVASDLHDKNSDYIPDGKSIIVTKSQSYYAQSQKGEMKYVATYEEGSHIKNLSSGHGECTVAASYNGQKQDESCTIVAPNYEVEDGYQVLGFSEKKDDNIGTDNLVMTQDATFYANAAVAVGSITYYHNGVVVGKNSVKAGENIVLTPAKELNISKNGYSFNGWTTNPSISTSEYKDIDTIKNMPATAINLYSLWIDDIAPSCNIQFSKGTYAVDEKLNVTLTCTDEGVGFDTSNNVAPKLDSDFFIANGKQYSSFVINSANCSSNPHTFTCNYDVSTNVVNHGAYLQLSSGLVKDANGKGNKLTFSDFVTIEGKTLTATLTKEGVDGISKLGSTAVSCTTELDNRYCSVDLKNVDLELEDGYRWAGWSRDLAYDTEIGTGQFSFYLTEDTTFYPLVQSYISDALVYNQTPDSPNFCVTGEERTCQKTDCYKNKTDAECPSGTIIKYVVRNSTKNGNKPNDVNLVTSLKDDIHTFNVVKDNKNTLTMQENKATGGGTYWGSLKDGPVTVISNIEKSTANWDFVNNQTYTLGETPFEGNSYTTCAYNWSNSPFDCSTNSYTWESRTAKARIMSIKEAEMVGCTTVDKSCPLWMYNYLNGSIAHGGTEESQFYSLALMNAVIYNSDPAATDAFFIVNANGRFSYELVTYPSSARAVVEINKRY